VPGCEWDGLTLGRVQRTLGQRCGRSGWTVTSFKTESQPAPGSCGLGAAGRCCADRRAGRGRSPERVWTLGSVDPSCTPAGIPSNSSDDEGCWGGETAGTETNGVVGVARVVAVPDGGAAVMRVVEPGAAAQQPGDPPSILVLVADQGGGHWRRHGEKTAGGAAPGYGHGGGTFSVIAKNRGSCGAGLKQPNSQGQTNSRRAKGQSAQAPRREPGGEKQPGRKPTVSTG